MIIKDRDVVKLTTNSHKLIIKYRKEVGDHSVGVNE